MTELIFLLLLVAMTFVLSPAIAGVFLFGISMVFFLALTVVIGIVSVLILVVEYCSRSLKTVYGWFQ